MRKLASVRQVKATRPIPDADKIMVAVVDGWECVVKKDEFQVGEKVVYIEIDSIMPATKEYEFLEPRKYRVRTIKLRGQISQGLVLPMSVLKKKPEKYAVGDDVTEELGVKKYDPQAEHEAKLIEAKKKKTNPVKRWLMRFSWFRKIILAKEPVKAFPDWIKKTDETRIQNAPRLFEDIKRRKIKCYSTEKIEGQSGTFFYDTTGKKPVFGVCSRNWWLVKRDTSSYWSIAEQYNMQEVLKDMAERFGAKRVVIQGEIVGPGIQKNIYKLDKYDIYVFNILIDSMKFDANAITEIIGEYNIKAAPIVSTYEELPETMAELINASAGQSQLADVKREGRIYRNIHENISFKVINPEYLLNQE